MFKKYDTMSVKSGRSIRSVTALSGLKNKLGSAPATEMQAFNGAAEAVRNEYIEQPSLRQSLFVDQ